MKMKNYLKYELPESSDSIYVAVSHREILRIAERFISEGSKYVVTNVTFSHDPNVIVDPTDLHFASSDGIRFFRIDKRQNLSNSKIMNNGIMNNE